MSADNTTDEITALEARLALLKSPPPPREQRRSKVNALLDGELRYLEAIGAPLMGSISFLHERGVTLGSSINDDDNKEIIESAASNLSVRISNARARLAEARRLLDIAEQGVKDARA